VPHTHTHCSVSHPSPFAALAQQPRRPSAASLFLRSTPPPPSSAPFHSPATGARALRSPCAAAASPAHTSSPLPHAAAITRHRNRQVHTHTNTQTHKNKQRQTNNRQPLLLSACLLELRPEHGGLCLATACLLTRTVGVFLRLPLPPHRRVARVLQLRHLRAPPLKLLCHGCQRALRTRRALLRGGKRSALHTRQHRKSKTGIIKERGEEKGGYTTSPRNKKTYLFC
jgi:hypothetical protein